MKHWQIKKREHRDLIKQLLFNRGVSNQETFLNPDFKKLHNPFLMKNMDKTISRFLSALKNKEKIGIFADYDADGIPGAALLSKFFDKLKINYKVIIPTRGQGYGLNKKAVEELRDFGATLIITIDCGITSVVESELAKKLGMEVIIIDHHEAPKNLPKVLAILDPKQRGDKYPFRELSGAGVAFKFIQAFVKKYGKQYKLSESFLKWNLDLVGISTICDVVPLNGENRILAKFGLLVLRKTRNLGLKKLYQIAAITPEKIDTYNVGFQIGPRLNAPGRMEEADDSFKLLTTRDEKEASELAKKLNRINVSRQEELEKTFEEAQIKVLEKNLHHNHVILVDGKDWQTGIVGLVAGRLMEKYNRPTIVLCRGEKQCQGSARSIDNFDLISALNSCQGYLLKHGGHKKAAGLTLENEYLDALYDELQKLAQKKLTKEDLLPKVKIDAQIETHEINLKLVKTLEKFEPFGIGNPRPNFMLEGARILSMRPVGQKEKHLQILLDLDGKQYKSIGFDMGKFFQELKVNDKIDLVFSLGINEWNNQSNIELRLLDFRAQNN